MWVSATGASGFVRGMRLRRDCGTPMVPGESGAGRDAAGRRFACAPPRGIAGARACVARAAGDPPKALEACRADGVGPRAPPPSRDGHTANRAVCPVSGVLRHVDADSGSTPRTPAESESRGSDARIDAVCDLLRPVKSRPAEMTDAGARVAPRGRAARMTIGGPLSRRPGTSRPACGVRARGRAARCTDPRGATTAWPAASRTRRHPRRARRAAAGRCPRTGRCRGSVSYTHLTLPTKRIV